MSTDLGTSLKAAGAVASLKKEEPTCPDVDFKYRLIGFLVQGVIGLLLVIYNVTTTDKTIELTFGIIILFTSALWIINYKNLFKKMLDPVRMINAFILFGCMAATLVLYFMKLNDKLQPIPFIIGIVECVACVWYLLSFIPFAQKLCTALGKSCCNACLKGEDA